MDLDTVIAEMERLGPRRKDLWAARRGKPHQPLSDNRRVLIAQAFAANIDYRQVAELTGIDPSITYNWHLEWIEGDYHKTTTKTFGQIRSELLKLKEGRESLNDQYEAINKEMKKLVARGYELGMGLHEMERHSGVNRPALRVWLGIKKGGWVYKTRREMSADEKQ
ncbi:hypothetical protein AB8O38_01960 [Saccharomonospora xinjiangensis]